MTQKLPRITAGEAIRVLEKAGVLLARQSGSHKIYKNREGKRVTVPYH
jgi:predicted RNA binding protein YcfA (HicA-like mRNA interferase family)